MSTTPSPSPIPSWRNVADYTIKIRELQKQIKEHFPFDFKILAGDGAEICPKLFYTSTFDDCKDTSLFSFDILPSSDFTNLKGEEEPDAKRNCEYTLCHKKRYSCTSNKGEDKNDLPTENGAKNVALSKEEELVRERCRDTRILTQNAVTFYSCNDTKNHVLFKQGNRYFIENLDVKRQRLDAWIEEVDFGVSSCQKVLDIKMCPDVESNILSFVYDSNIWIRDILDKRTLQLTFVDPFPNGVSQTSRSRFCGEPSFIIQEEFDRYTGFYWNPVVYERVDDKEASYRVYQILYEENDESDIVEIKLPSSFDDPSNNVEAFRYPRAGDKNVTTELKIVEFVLPRDLKPSLNNPSSSNASVKNRALPFPIKIIFPWAEYVIRFGWVKIFQLSYVWMQLLSRDQKFLSICALPVYLFEEFDQTHSSTNSVTVEQIKQKVITLHQEMCLDSWININDIFYPLSEENDDKNFSFIFSSEKSENRHLYLKKLTLASQLNGASAKLKCTEVALTSGNWQVQNSKIWVNQSKGVLFFTGNRDSVLEFHLYCLNYACEAKATLTQLTPPMHSNEITMDESCTFFICVSNCIFHPPFVSFYCIDYKSPCVVQSKFIEYVYRSAFSSDLTETLCVPNIRSYYPVGPDTPIYTMQFKPQSQSKSEKVPLVVFVYGGPHAKLVSNAFVGSKNSVLFLLLHFGYAVVMIDNRGSCDRGKAFEKPLKLNMGRFELYDIIKTLHLIHQKEDICIDFERVGIFGHSYGGYLSLMALCKYNDFFKVGVAGAPVVSWNLYDTAYTERYMGDPNGSDQDAYSKSSVLTYADDFPREFGRLLIVHGTLDENVHFAHSALLIKKLSSLCIPYSLVIYPEERHGIRNFSQHYAISIVKFFIDNL